MSVKQPVDGIDMSNGIRRGGRADEVDHARLAKDGITINLVLPGMFLTSRINAAPVSGRASRERKLAENSRRRLAAQIPLARLGEPIELGHLVAFLASEQASSTHHRCRLPGGRGQASRSNV